MRTKIFDAIVARHLLVLRLGTSNVLILPLMLYAGKDDAEYVYGVNMEFEDPTELNIALASIAHVAVTQVIGHVQAAYFEVPQPDLKREILRTPLFQTASFAFDVGQNFRGVLM